MAVAAPLSVTVLPETAFFTPKMDGETVAKILDNGNHLYRDFRPALVDACPVTKTDAADRSWTVPVQPSLDGLRYRFDFTWLPQFNGRVTLRVQESATVGGVYTDVVPATLSAVGALGVWQSATFNAAIPATSRVLRFRMTGAGGSFYPGQIRAAPDPNTGAVPFVAPYGETASGFRVFDDSLLRSASAPVNTEMLDRALRNARAVVRDRQQCVFSFLQDDGTFRTAKYPDGAVTPPTTSTSMLLGASKFYIPHEGDTWIDVRVIATTTSATTTNRVTVDSAAQSVSLTANGAVQTARLRVKGPLASVAVRSSVQTYGDTTRVIAAVGLWRPGDTA